MTRILFCEMPTLISDILYYRYLSHYFGWGGKGNVLFGIGSDFFCGGDFKPQNIEPQNVGPGYSSGAGEGEENIEVMVLLSDSRVFDLFFGD